MGKFFFNLNAKKRLSNCDSKFRGNKTKYRQILLHFTDSVFLFVCLFFVLQTEGLWQLHMELFYQCHLCNSICSLHVSVSHFGILPYFKVFITCYGDLRSVAFDVIVIAFRHRELCPYRLMNPTDTSSACSVFSKPHWSGIPISHSPQVSLFPETQQYWN